MKVKNLFLFFLFVAALTFSAHSQEPKNDHSYFTGGKIHVVPSSHQDIAWMDTPEKCIEFRDLFMITPALERMRENADFKFCVENALNLYEYLERHPESFEEIKKFTENGQLEWGANYNQPYEGMYDGEALIRQTYLGKKRLQKMMPGGNYTCAWDEDVPGRTLQRPQMLAKAGVKYLQFSRFEPGLYNWYSPDGSYISCWTPGQYECSGRPIRGAKTESARTEAFTEMLNHWNGYYLERNLSPDYIYLSSHDFSKPLNYDAYFADWNRRVKNKESDLPQIHYSTGATSIEAALRKGKPDSIMGERPNLWLYIHGPGHERTLKASRYASRRLVAAEKWATFDAALRDNFSKYPQDRFTAAWEDAIFADHGWGGRFGHITDKLFRTKFENAGKIANQEVLTATQNIAQHINCKDNGTPVVVFNALSWTRYDDPVSFTLNTEGVYSNSFKLVDSDGNNVDYQLSVPEDADSDSKLKFVFIASEVPAHGYKTYYLLPDESGKVHRLSMDRSSSKLSTPYYIIQLKPGGISSIFDKQLQQELVNDHRWLCGEVFSLESVGHGAGEFTRVQQPTMQGFTKMSQYQPAWQLVENGAVRTVLESVHPWEHCTVKQRLIVYNQIKRLDFQVELLAFDGKQSREFRMAFPMAVKGKNVAYEVPMAVVEVGKSELPIPGGFSKPEQIYDTPCTDIHPREVQDWFGCWDENKGVTISSDVAVFDWIDPTNSQSEEIVLQPLLMATRRSCNGSSDSNWYLQRGNHYFSFSLTSHEPGWIAGRKFGDQANQPLDVLVVKNKSNKGQLPESFSFAGIDKDNVIVSTIKKGEDDNHIIMRCYDIEGKDENVGLSWFKGIRKLYHTNIIEEDQHLIKSKNKKTEVTIGQYAIETFKIE